MTLQNTGTTPIGALWFARDDIAGTNLINTFDMTVGASAAPTGWTAIVTHNGPPNDQGAPWTDGYGILWTANTPQDRLLPGATLAGFDFRPASGNSPSLAHRSSAPIRAPPTLLSMRPPRRAAQVSASPPAPPKVAYCPGCTRPPS